MRTVHCAKLGADLPGLEKPPFTGALGQEIFEKISEQAWKSWHDDFMIKVINEYRLNLADEEHYKILIEQMKGFLNLSDTETLEVENEKRGRSA